MKNEYRSKRHLSKGRSLKTPRKQLEKTQKGGRKIE
jgi:hypothetical protein